MSSSQDGLSHVLERCQNPLNVGSKRIPKPSKILRSRSKNVACPEDRVRYIMKLRNGPGYAITN